MASKPIEVVIRNPKWTGQSAVARFVGYLTGIALVAALIMWMVPPVASVFGIEAHPNYGESLLILLLVRVTLKGSNVMALQSYEKNEYWK